MGKHQRRKALKRLRRETGLPLMTCVAVVKATKQGWDEVEKLCRELKALECHSSENPTQIWWDRRVWYELVGPKGRCTVQVPR